MFYNKIEFKTSKIALKVFSKEDYPSPAKKNLPEWFKKLQHNPDNLTVKGCMPFFDALTAGYILKIPQDIRIHHKYNENKNENFSPQRFSFEKFFSLKYNINLNNQIEAHPTEQLKGSPLIEKNNNLPFHKIMNPWTIKTPKGYSCLFVSLLNNEDDRFSPLAGIVDTDTYEKEINFPIVINCDKYKELDTILKKGTPYVQIIPFKREKWKMSIKEITVLEKDVINMKYFLNFFRIYQNKFWSKKTWI